MLVEFRVKNFRSIRDEQVLSLVASKGKELSENITQISNFEILKSAVIYGANSSGKSNFIKAFEFMQNALIAPFISIHKDEIINYEPFRLNELSESEPTMVEMTFFTKGVRYRYGFEINAKEVLSEWLFYVPRKQEIPLFIRERDEFQIHATLRKEAKGLVEKTRDNILFLSVLNQFNSKLTEIVYQYISDMPVITSDMRNFLAPLFERIKSDSNQKIINELLKKIDVQIENLSFKEESVDLESLPSELKMMMRKDEGELKTLRFITTHKKLNDDNEEIELVDFDLSIHESEGTKQFLALAGPLLDTLADGGVIIIDELENSLHALLMEFIIKMFKHCNKESQLIFSTHNTKLLSDKYFRRDQIWFTNKDKQGATGLLSLYDYSVRKDASWEKDYLAGKYNAIPYIEEISGCFNGN